MEKEWLKPKLVILVRGKPEERVLDGCKDHVEGMTADQETHTNCQKPAADPSGWCDPCFGYSGT